MYILVCIIVHNTVSNVMCVDAIVLQLVSEARATQALECPTNGFMFSNAALVDTRVYTHTLG